MEHFLVQVTYKVNEEVIIENIQVNEAEDVEDARSFAEIFIRENRENIQDIVESEANPLPLFDVFSWNTAIYHALSVVDSAFYLDEDTKRKVKEDVSSQYRPV